MDRENILIPCGRHSSGLKALYHAFALAERISAKIFVLLFKGESLEHDHGAPLEKACLEMIHSACEEGMSVSFHIAGSQLRTKLLNIIKMERIDLIVIGAGDSEIEAAVKGIQASVSVQIVKVREKGKKKGRGKNNINSLKQR